jgi:hypothetical protein
LSLGEAAEWIRGSGDVQLFCEAIPWPQEPDPRNLQAQHKRRRSFAAVSGDLPIRVAVSVVASFDGPCPYLLPDMRCGAYEVRPLVCRIYPAEVNPFIGFDPASKACPPEAWATHQPVFMIAGQPLEPATVLASNQFRANDYREAPARAKLCSLLRISTASLANEGFVIHSVEREVMLDALSRIKTEAEEDSGLANWAFVTNRTGTHETLLEIGARVSGDDFTSANGSVRYLAF